MSQNGTNHTIISVSQLAKGLYICYLQSGEKVLTIKIPFVYLANKVESV
jgi:hypothetical protein